ncbi:unnamed protein product [Alopecurus aequalis]
MACENQDVALLPDDIVMEVLSYLPAKSIGRFRSASSSWDAQLLSPSFVELHRRRANNPGQQKLFFSPTDEPSEEYDHFYSWQPGGGPVKKLMENQLCCPTPLTKPLHGLVLIRSIRPDDGGYDVCNPSTGEFLALPDTRLPLKTIVRYSRTQPKPPSYLDVAYGLGYCSVNQEYKVVRVFSDPYMYETAPTSCELCFFDRRAWPEPERVQLQSKWVTPLAAMCNGQKKVMFGTGTCKVFAVDLDGGAPEIMLSPEEDIPGASFDDTADYPAIGLLEESLVPLGRIDEEMHLLSPTTEAWRDVLKWLPTRLVLELSLPCHGCDFLCNRAIRYHQRIRHDEDDQQADPFPGRIALGYDSHADDHVLVFLAYEEKNLDTREYKLRCNVRCVIDDAWWCRVEPPPRPVAGDAPPTYADGKIYWVIDPNLGPRSEATCCELVAFDTIQREFKVVEGPPCRCSHSGRVSVVELHGVIHVAWSDRDADAIDVWMMEDDGVWRAEYRIELAKYSPEYSSETALLIAHPFSPLALLKLHPSHNPSELGIYSPSPSSTIHPVALPRLPPAPQATLLRVFAATAWSHMTQPQRRRTWTPRRCPS